jgi:hypothetical protein
MNEDHFQKVRERAHALWEQAGRPHGQDAEHWSQAEREIAAEEDAQSSASIGRTTGRRGRKSNPTADQTAAIAPAAKRGRAGRRADEVATDPPKVTRGRKPKAIPEEGAEVVKVARNRRSKQTSEDGAVVPVGTGSRKRQAAAAGKGNTSATTPGDTPKVVAEGSDTAE